MGGLYFYTYPVACTDKRIKHRLYHLTFDTFERDLDEFDNMPHLW